MQVSAASSNLPLTTQVIKRAGEAAQQRTLALWGALLLGVAILGAMTWKLVRDLQRKPDSTDKR